MVRIVDDLLDVSRITQGEVELRREAGFTYHFTKPVDVPSLTSLLARLGQADQNRPGDA